MVRFDVGQSPDYVCSYRGYYEDLGVIPQDGTQTVGGFLQDLREALGETFTGYKGGEYVMDESTPLWMADYGCCGRAIVGIRDTEDAVVLETIDEE